MSKKVHVLTRTSGRPNFFKICKASIRQQTYNNLNHILIVDDANTSPVRSKQVPWHVGNDYTHSYDDVQRIDIKWEELDHFEQSLNYALDSIPDEDYFCVLDDDDFFTSPNTVEIAVRHINDGDILFWQVSAAGGVVPDRNHFYGKNTGLPYGQVAMIGWLIKKSFVKDCRFNPIYGGDADFIHQLTQGNVKTPNIRWLEGIYSATNPMQPQGEGCCRDIDLQRALRGFKNRSKGFNYDIV